jgi:hypothetical protein
MDKKALYIGGGVGVAALGALAYAFRETLFGKPAAVAVPAGVTPRFSTTATPGATAAPTNVFSMQGPDGQVQTATNMGELKSRLLTAWGSEDAARTANVYLPGDTAWHPAGTTVFGPIGVIIPGDADLQVQGTYLKTPDGQTLYRRMGALYTPDGKPYPTGKDRLVVTDSGILVYLDAATNRLKLRNGAPYLSGPLSFINPVGTAGAVRHGVVGARGVGDMSNRRPGSFLHRH